MEQQSQQSQTNAPTLCANNCGFFGSSATNNLCSKCYRDYFLKQSKAASAVITAVAEKKPVETVVETVTALVDSNDGGGSSNSGDPVKRLANRCGFCKKRVGLTGFKCKCDQTFCEIHRYSDKHNCVFDYKTAAQDAIAKANPVVKAEKIDKI